MEGLVGPLVDSGVLLVEALPECVADACDVDAREDMIQFVRQVRALRFWCHEELHLLLQGGSRLHCSRRSWGQSVAAPLLHMCIKPACLHHHTWRMLGQIHANQAPNVEASSKWPMTFANPRPGLPYHLAAAPSADAARFLLPCSGAPR
jgi:hypothetical protein